MTLLYQQELFIGTTKAGEGFLMTRDLPGEIKRLPLKSSHESKAFVGK